MTETIRPAQHEIVPPGAEEGTAGIDLLVALQDEGKITPTQLSLLDPSLPFETWTAVGRFLGRVKRSSSWWIGDWINFGEGVYGERYAAAVDVTGLAPETLMNYAYVARYVPPSRRVAALPFSVHADVAPLEPAEQAEWLRRCLDEGWSRSQFRDALAEAKAVPPAGRENGGTALGEGQVRAAKILEDAARAVATTAQRDGDRFLVPLEPMARLLSALGFDE